MTKNKQLERLQIIYDTDREPIRIEGWCVCMWDQDGKWDKPIEFSFRKDARGCLSKRQESTLRSEARRVARANGYCVPSTLTVEIR